MKVFISTSSFGRTGRQPLDMLEAFGVAYTLNPYGRKLRPEESVEVLATADGLLAGTESLNRDVLSRAPRLKVISRVGTGLDSVDLAAAEELGISVYSTPDAHVDAVAELTLAGMLNVLRRVPQADRTIRRGQWQKPMGNLLRGKTVGIVGLGRIGKALATLLRPFGGEIVAADPIPDHAFSEEVEIRYMTLEELLAEADIVTLHLPFSSERYHLFDDSVLGQMKRGSILVNCARGGLVDEEALANHLRAGHLSGAYLDTFEREPYEGPLTGMSNVVLTPHMGSYAAECRLQMETEAVENLLRYFADTEGP
jgi:D-3-phosphoglycerate dehydrogenase